MAKSKSKCQIWQGTYDRGICYDNLKHNMARLIYQNSTGEILHAGEKVGRTCKDTKCLNPKHLFKYSGVIHYTIPEYPVRTGINNQNVVLTLNQVLEIRDARTKGSSLIYLSNRYNVSKTHIWRIVKHKSWSHV